MTSSVPYSMPVTCSAGDPLTFDLPIRLQQVSESVPAKFSLNTMFHFTRKKSEWLSSSNMVYKMEEEDAAFVLGDTIYGRITMDPLLSHGKQYSLSVESVLVCSGKDGYIPSFDPDHNQYGCSGSSDNLNAVYRIIDVAAPYTVDLDIGGVSFNAETARGQGWNDASLGLGTDGFLFDSSPLFQTERGRMWFLHVVYSIRSPGKVEKRGEDSIVRHSISDMSGIRSGERGTNMAPIILDYSGKSHTDETYLSDRVTDREGQMQLIAVLIGVGSVLLIAIFVLVIFIHHRRKNASPPPTPTGTITVMSTSPGQTRVISNAHVFTKNNLSEV